MARTGTEQISVGLQKIDQVMTKEIASSEKKTKFGCRYFFSNQNRIFDLHESRLATI